MPWDEWLAKHGGSKIAGNFAVEFTNIEPSGAEGAFRATPVAVVPLTGEALRKRRLIVPIDLPIPFDDMIGIQCAREWASGGKGNIDISKFHVFNMYYSALQSLLFTAGSAKTPEEQRKWFPAIVSMVRVFDRLHEIFPDFRRVSEAMVITPGVNDSIQKALAHIFVRDAPWDDRTVLGLLEMVVRRSLRRREKSVGLAPGPFVVFGLVPLLRAVFLTEAEYLVQTEARGDALASCFNAKAETLLKNLATLGDADNVQTRSLVALSRTAGVPLTPVQVYRFLDHVRDHPMAEDGAPWERWDVVPPQPKLQFGVTSRRFDVEKHKQATFAALITPLSVFACKAVSYKPDEWCGVHLGVGRHNVDPRVIGIAKHAGICSAPNDPLVANCRLTVGSNVLPPFPGVSLAGVEHRKNQATGKWEYAPVSDENATLFAPFTVDVSPTHVRLCQYGDQLFCMPRLGMPALLCFKNMWLNISSEPLKPNMPPARVLSPIAQIAQLHAAAAAK